MPLPNRFDLLTLQNQPVWLQKVPVRSAEIQRGRERPGVKFHCRNEQQYDKWNISSPSCEPRAQGVVRAPNIRHAQSGVHTKKFDVVISGEHRHAFPTCTFLLYGYRQQGSAVVKLKSAVSRKKQRQTGSYTTFFRFSQMSMQNSSNPQLVSSQCDQGELWVRLTQALMELERAYLFITQTFKVGYGSRHIWFWGVFFSIYREFRWIRCTDSGTRYLKKIRKNHAMPKPLDYHEH